MLRFETRPRVRRSGERDRLRGSCLWQQEVPCGVDERGRRVGADVARPDDGRAQRSQDRDESERLRIVNDDDVARSHGSTDVGRVGTGDRLEMAPLLFAQRTTVAEHAVEPVVDPFRDREELRVALDHGPMRVDPVGGQISQAGSEQLRDATALGRRVDVPDGPAVEDPACVVEAPFVTTAGIRPRDRTEALCSPRMNGDLVHRKNDGARRAPSSSSVSAPSGG